MPPVFGVDRDMIEVAPKGRNKDGSYKSNPMLVFGPGPEGKKCGDCKYLWRRGDVAGRFYKCDFRDNTCGAKTDHRVRWPACIRFEERND